ncbi:hypothetical protein CCAX7_006320 [Capsulimonas corticalis]|uniref:Uncharacterized protein n=1 Tax=Capsulimonas corticalis TaxID=2219043 RepID=A0A402D3C8_9BACT|nr:DUF4328 domain-containing protein [Capsulimonas corticalis]BDI28581.1 hypothetical protein CCAX7_006320 [Capsulimonas corticalis]
MEQIPHIDGGVWPPPPTNAIDDGRSRMLSLLSQYRSPTVLTRWMLGCLAVAVVTDVAEAIGLLGGLSAHAFTEAISEASSFITLAAGVVFLVWIHRLYKNLTALGIANLRHSPGVAVIMFILPFINLYKPIVIVREIWRATSPQATLSIVKGRWTETPSTPLIGFWWIAYLCYNLVNTLIAVNSSNSQFETAPYEVGAALSVLSGTLLAVLALMLTERQEQRYTEIAANVSRA